MKMWILWSTPLLLLVWSNPGGSENGGCRDAHGLSKDIKEFCNINSTHSCSEIWKEVSPGCYAIGAVILLVPISFIIITIIIIIIITILCSRPVVQRNKERKKQEKDERVYAHQLVETFIEENQEYELPDKMSDLGCRLQKYWYRGYSRELKSEIIITVAPISKSCPIKLNTDTVTRINQKILPTVCKHSSVHPILGVHYASDSHVIVVQQLTSRGSLRDLLYKSQYALDWSLKYSKKSVVLNHKEIVLYGRQILEAMMFLYKHGFPALRHIHTGNILVSDHGCTLGGIDNSLLGYKTSIHRYLEKTTLPYIDVIMFGRVIFEMASEKELHDLIPDEQDLSSVDDKEVKRMLKSIFEVDDEGMFKHSVEEIMQQLVTFFKPEHHSSSGVKLSSDKKIREILGASSPIQQPKMTTASRKDINLKLDDIMKKLGYAADSEEFIQIGWRVDKYWKLVSSPENSIMSFAKVSKTCPIFLTQSTINTINGFLKTCCSECQVLHPIHGVQFCSGYVATTQPLQRASLKDVILKTKCLEKWSEKLKGQGNSLERNRIFIYSKQILQAVLTLYEAGFPPLGSIQTGNIFVDGDVCQLGGYENTLLGYRSHFHEKFSDQDTIIEAIDVVMFGHVVFEMGSGRELGTLTPSEEDYQAVPDEEVKRFLQLIFKMKDRHFIQTIEKIYEGFKADRKDFAISVSEDMKYLLSKVSKGKVRKNTTMRRFRAAAGNKAKKGASAVKEGASAIKEKGYGTFKGINV